MEKKSGMSVKKKTDAGLSKLPSDDKADGNDSSR
jgi:hypothetical protein